MDFCSNYFDPEIFPDLFDHKEVSILRHKFQFIVQSHRCDHRIYGIHEIISTSYIYIKLLLAIVRLASPQERYGDLTEPDQRAINESDQ